MIQIEGVSKSFQRRSVLDHVTLHLRAGERVALIGANGAGKTTLIRCLLGHYRYSGRIRIDGHSPRDQRTRVLRGVGFVPQLPPPLRIPVGELLRFAAAVYGTERSKMNRVAERLGLDLGEVVRRPFVKLSGGQKQKLLVAVALGRPTRVLVLDEPTANLDPPARRSLFDLLAERPKEGVTLLSSHRVDEVAGLVDRVVELDQGRVVLDEHLSESSEPTQPLQVHLELRPGEKELVERLARWGLAPAEELNVFEGSIAEGERHRFLAFLARHGAAVRRAELREADENPPCERPQAPLSSRAGVR